jgi:AcrR family transcriptional regulator
MAPPTPRRTQAERRESTIAALVDAAVSALGEVGYARTTTAEICRRAGVSQGGLFRHFESRLDLIVAAADGVRARQFVAFRAGLEALPEITVRDCLLLLRQACRAPMNAAWYELLLAARTDDALRERLGPFVERYHREISAIGRSLPVAGLIPDAELDTVLLTIVHLLDGEAMTAAVHAHPDQEDLRIEQLVRMLSGEAAFGLVPGD